MSICRASPHEPEGAELNQSDSRRHTSLTEAMLRIGSSLDLDTVLREIIDSIRASLEALVETSPVGVAVFDAGSGEPLSFNREARRIVETMRMPGHSAE